jgi:hypothetical protein
MCDEVGVRESWNERCVGGADEASKTLLSSSKADIETDNDFCASCRFLRCSMRSGIGSDPWGNRGLVLPMIPFRRGNSSTGVRD